MSREGPSARLALGERPDNIHDFSNQFVVEDRPGPHKRNCREIETDLHRLTQRQKQIDFGKNTIAYQRYIREVPKELRRKVVEGKTATCIDPVTPDITLKTSKRGFDGLVKAWRRDLHKWDDPDANAEEPVPFVDVQPGCLGAHPAEPEDISGGNCSSSSQSRGSKRSYQEAMEASLPVAHEQVEEEQAPEAATEHEDSEEDAVMVHKEDTADIFGSWEEDDDIAL